jgi:hypothetical protein
MVSKPEYLKGKINRKKSVSSSILENVTVGITRATILPAFSILF